MTANVLFSTHENGVATITLNRPEAINSLTLHMLQPIQNKLNEWKNDEHIHLIIIRGEGEKGFCAGGDMKTLYESRLSETFLRDAEQFFQVEYDLDQFIYEYPKPIIACLDGIVMGGGVGLTYGASHRIVTERTKWAMPEMNIGFFPDVGAAHFLNKAPGFIGRYLALTASMIEASDVLYINGADVFMTHQQLHIFIEAVYNTDWEKQNIEMTLTQLIDQYAEEPIKQPTLSPRQRDIDFHFSCSTVEEIVQSLQSDSSEFATQTIEALLAKSPVSLKVTLKQLVDGEHKSREACFATDLVLASHFMRHDDFFEGVRSVLIDKDRDPQYTYQRLADVSSEMVNNFFTSP